MKGSLEEIAGLKGWNIVIINHMDFLSGLQSQDCTVGQYLLYMEKLHQLLLLAVTTLLPCAKYDVPVHLFLIVQLRRKDVGM